MKTLVLRVVQILGAFVIGLLVWTALLLVVLGTVKIGPLVAAGATLLVAVSYAIYRFGFRDAKPSGARTPRR